MSSNLIWFGSSEGRPSAADKFYRNEVVISSATGKASIAYIPVKNAAESYEWLKLGEST